MIEEKTLKTLEYDKILKHMAFYANSLPAKNEILEIKPVTEISAVEELLNETLEADIILHELCISPSFAFDDISDCLVGAEKKAILSMSQILRVGRVLRVARIAKSEITSANDARIKIINKFCSNIYVNQALENTITESILSDSEVSDNASSELKSIRRDIRLCNEKIRQKLNNFISMSAYSKYLQDNIITMRNNRYVVPVKSEFKGQVDGLVHDQSASGSTTFIEPLAIVNLNNELKGLVMNEAVEIEKILHNLSLNIHDELFGISQAFIVITELDVIFARASYARAIKAIYPKLNQNRYINILSGRHPLIASEKVVPIDVEIGGKTSAMVITGPNTGGKTVTLKLVGLFTLMTMSGIFIPASADSEVGIFDGIYCDIGDEQSIENNLSTFSSHLNSLINITQKIDKNSLVLLDELGAGTDPAEGSALAIAVIEYLRAKKCVIITTSHYNELKEYSFATEGVCNACMDFDPNTFRPTYKLLVGISGNSNALEIAQVLGLNQSIVDKARSLLSKEKIAFDKIISSAEKARRDAEAYKLQIEENLRLTKIDRDETEKNLESSKVEKEKLDEKLRKNAKELLSDYIDEAEELIDELKAEIKKNDENALFEARKITKRLKNMETPQESEPSFDKIDGEISIGDKVYVKSLLSVAEVVSINDKKNEFGIKVGILTTCVKQNDAERIKLGKCEAKKKQNVNKIVEFSNVPCPMELMLLGKRVDEAIYETDQYLDKAKAQGYTEVRIVHGKGTGILRKALHEHFKTMPEIASFRIGNYGEGDSGVTIVTLK